MLSKWGKVTGVKPIKFTRELHRGNRYNGKPPHKPSEVYDMLTDYYEVSDEKAALMMEIYNYQEQKTGTPDFLSCGVYIGIPFCPSRCLYCSFTSNQRPYEEIERYLTALLEEISFVGKRMKESGFFAESIYIGGGTPTTLTSEELDRLLGHIKASFDMNGTVEFTVEAGRPDTIDEEKLAVIAKHGADRISINPQSMKDSTLRLIGRDHSSDDIREALRLADKSGIGAVNCDLIAGLPEEDAEDFRNTLTEIIDFRPKNITVHTLAVKRASRLIEQDENYHEKHALQVAEMIDISSRMLREAGYRPYYLYRLKRMAGALENVGWCRDDEPCIYNIRIMDEQQSIVALGAGGVSKLYFPYENRLERIENVSNYEVYIDRLNEMLMRKEDGIFRYSDEIKSQIQKLG